MILPNLPKDAGDSQIQEAILIAAEWENEVGSAFHREWEDLQFLGHNRDGPLVLKGIQPERSR